MFQIGQKVVLNGDLYVGGGTVVGVSPSAGSGVLDENDKVKSTIFTKRTDQPFPQFAVRCDDGKLRHYNRKDVFAGKIGDAPEPVVTEPTTGHEGIVAALNKVADVLVEIKNKL